MVISITLPLDDEILVKAGEDVDFSTSLLKEQLKDLVTIPLAKILHIPATKIFHHLKKFVGDEVKKDDLIAERPSLLSKKAYYCEIDGVIKEVNHEEGYIVIETKRADETRMKSYFKGQVVSIDKQTLELKVGKSKDFSMKSATENFGGEVAFFPTIKEDLIEDKVQHKVVFAPEITVYQQVKLEALGAKGFVTVHSLAQHTSLPVAKIKDAEEWEKISGHSFPYCTINKESTTIYLYE